MKWVFKRVIALVFQVVLLSPTWANAYFIRGYCLQDLHCFAEAKKAIAQPWLFLQTCSPRAGSVGFLYNFLKRPGHANTIQVAMNYGSRHSGNGDEFNADFAPATMGYNPAKTIYNGGFETFCVEENEYFTPRSTYNYGISQKAVKGDVGWSPS